MIYSGDDIHNGRSSNGRRSHAGAAILGGIHESGVNATPRNRPDAGDFLLG